MLPCVSSDGPCIAQVIGRLKSLLLLAPGKFPFLPLSFYLPEVGGKHIQADLISMITNEIHLPDQRITNLHRPNDERSSEAPLQSYQ